MINEPSSISTKAVPLLWVEKLFARMEALYGNKFIDMWRGTNVDLVKGLWADEMGKLSADDLRRGYAALMDREWPPTLPEFVKACRSNVDPLVAYYEAVAGVQARSKGEMGVWSHPAIYWAAMPLTFDLLSQGYSTVRHRWDHSLADQLAKGKWEPIPEPMAQLPAPEKSAKANEAAKKVMGELKAVGITKEAVTATDHKLWAKRIIEREKKGDKTLTLIQKKFAHEALEG
jgi:hypothetical protein